MRPLALCIALILSQLSSSGQYVFEGKIQSPSLFNKNGALPENVKDLWYLGSIEDYKKKEETQLDSCDIAYFNDSLGKVMDIETEAILKQTGVFNGFYHGVYFTKHKEGKREVQVNKDMYIAYLGLDLNRFNVWVNFVSLNRQYVMNYGLERKDNFAIFRIFSYSSNIEIRGEIQEQNLVINTTYNKQDLKLTISPRESKADAMKRKMGINKKPLTVFLPQETKNLEEVIDEQNK